MTKLAKMRKAAGLTQQQLADRVGVTRSALAMWELGANNLPSKYLLALAGILGCSVEELLRQA